MLVHPDKNPTMTDRASLAFEGMEYIKNKCLDYILSRDIINVILLLVIRQSIFKKISLKSRSELESKGS